jgi:hypothetical protein
MLPRDEVLRRLKLVRHSSYDDRVRNIAPTISDIARSIGVSREHLHQISSGKTPLGPCTRAKLSDYFEGCENIEGERASVSSTTAAAFGTGSGGVFTVKWPDFGPERPPKRGLSDRRS